MNLHHLRLFYEVARRGNMTLAAQKLRISQPAVSKMIRALESDLGVRLLERAKSGISLTPSGETAFEHASRIFAESDALRSRVRSAQARLEGDWCLGASDNLALHVLPELLADFKRKHPRLRLQLFAGTSTDIKSEILQDRCDLGIFYTPLKSHEPFLAEAVAETEFWAVLARKNAWFKPNEKPTIELLRERKVPRIESRSKDYQGPFPAHFHGAELGLMEEAPWIEANQHEIKRRFVALGCGFSILTRHTVQGSVENGEFIRVPTPQPMRSKIFAVTKRNKARSPVSAAFLERFRGEFPKRG